MKARVVLLKAKVSIRIATRHCASAPQRKIDVGISSICGRGHSKINEDRYYYEKFAPNIQCFSVFDGHNGTFVSQFLKMNLPSIIKKNIMKKRFDLYDSTFPIVEKVFMDSYIHCQNILAETIGMMKDLRRKDMVGSTAVVALLVDNKYLSIANVGDSKAILCRDGNAVELSVEHIPSNSDEYSRVKKNGGWVDWGSRLTPLVNGRLSMTRSFGNLLLKPDIVSCVPHIRHEVINDIKDSFIVLCSDGITHAMTDNEVVYIINQHDQPIEAAEDLTSTAQQYGSHDDATAIVVPLGLWECGVVRSQNTNYSMFRTIVGERSGG